MPRTTTSSRPPYASNTIVAFGDSFTAMTNGWFTRLMTYFPSTTGVNLGISGSALFERRPEIKRAWNNKPSILIVEFGLNDEWKGSTVNDYQINIEAVISDTKKNTGAKIIVPNLIYYAASNYSTNREAQYDSWRAAQKAAANNQGALFVDWHNSFQSAWQVSGNSLYSAYDDVHPSTAGFNVIGDAMKDAIINAGYDKYLTQNPQDRAVVALGTRSTASSRTVV